MGLRQRLSLAVAVLHEPQILILDEPTSGVDPVARDSFWELLIDLSRNQGVTIFVTTHFMNEGMRCDRISLMNAGKVLACDEPQKLIDGPRCAAAWRTPSSATWRTRSPAGRAPATARTAAAAAASRAPAAAPPAPPPAHAKPAGMRLRVGRMLAYTRNETMQILRDPVRLMFAFLGSARADAGVRVRHHDRRRAHPLRLARSGPVAREPPLPRAVRGLAAVLRRHAAGAARPTTR